ELAGEINTQMPEHVVQKIASALGQAGKSLNGSRVLLLGVAYKKNVDDPRESPAFRLLELLQATGAVVSYSDPHVPILPKMRSFQVPSLSSEELTVDFLARQDCVVVVTDHDAFDWPLIAGHASLIVDTRNALSRVANPRAKIIKA